MSTLHGEYRRHDRTDVKTNVTLDLEDTDLETKTKDVSVSGISLRKPPYFFIAPGESAKITFDKMPNLDVPARIVRVSENRISLEFDHFRFSQGDIEGIIRTAPWHQRLKASLKRAFWKRARHVAAFSTNTFARPAIVKGVKPSFLFAVYGSEKDVATYYTPTMAKVMPRILIGGLIQNRKQRGLLVASKYYENELADDDDKVREYLADLEAAFPDVQTIALVGRLPNFAMRAGIEIKPPYVDGSMGTRYMIWDVGCQMGRLPEYQNEPTLCVLGGAGRIGNLVCTDLAREYKTVIAFDKRYEVDEEIQVGENRILRTGDVTRLTECKLYISLTHHGDVIREFADYIPPGSLVADDTHPCISLEVREELLAKGIKTMKIVLSHDKFSMWPRMPGWNNRAIPGCLVEALVVAEFKDTNVSEFAAFRDSALEIGFKGELIKPLEE